MILVEMGDDKHIDFRHAFSLQTIQDFLPILFLSTVNDHSPAAAEQQDRVGLPDLEYLYLQNIPGLAAC